MKTRSVIFLCLVGLLFLAGWALAVAQTSQHAQPGSYQVESTAAFGDGYQLHPITWQIKGAIRGERYRIQDLSSLTSQGSGCCCNFLPCVTR